MAFTFPVDIEFLESLEDLRFKVKYNNEKKLMRKVIKTGDINFQDKNGYTILALAVIYNEFVLVKYLIDAGVNLNIQTRDINEPGLTPLMHATIKSSRFNIAKLLIECGADINLQDDYGNTALHYAISYNREKIVKLLLDNHADINIKDKNNATPLDRVSEYTYTYIKKLLNNIGKTEKEESIQQLLITLTKIKEIKEEKIIKQKEKIKNSKSYKIEKEIEKLYTGESLIFPKDSLRQIWDAVKKDEIILGETLKMMAEVKYPYLASLMLLDHENIDPLAYEVLINKIINQRIIGEISNPYIEKYNYDLLTTLFFDKQIIFSDDNIKNINKALLFKNLPYSKIWYEPGCKWGFDGDINSQYLRDIRYWILTHPQFKTNPTIFNDLYHDKKIQEYFRLLLENYKERVKLRELTKMPF